MNATQFEAEFTATEAAAIQGEFDRVGKNTYLDHAGATLYANRQVEAVGKMLKESLFGNPHTSKVTADLIDQVRYRILKHFNTDATEYAIVFTANATAALKLVAETFEFDGGKFHYCQENHTSVLGMRELVQTQQLYVLTKDELLQNLKAKFLINGIANGRTEPHVAGNSLVAFSAQCNFSGYKMPLDVVAAIQTRGLVVPGKCIRGENESAAPVGEHYNHYICLDTATFVGSNYLDLQAYKPDFCCISFYKLFGFPTGVGALLVSRRGQLALRKRYYGGGTVNIAMTRADFHVKRDTFSAQFEDGTLPFLSIVALLQGFRTLERLVPPTPTKCTMERIAAHVFALAQHCHDALAALRHANGAPLVRFYNHGGYKCIREQGGIVTFNLLHADGSYVGYAEIACIASVHDVQLRTGCFCNAGACQYFLQQSDAEIRRHYAAGHICSDYNDLVDGQPTGAVRLSFGWMTRLADVERIVAIISDCYGTTQTVQRLQLIDGAALRLPHALQQVVAQRLRPQLKRFCVYPVKSCGAYEVTDAWPLLHNGFKYDRHWMIVDGNGMAMTQKHHTRLCLIRPLIDVAGGMLELTFPAMQSVRVPLQLSIETQQPRVASGFCQSKVCNDLVEGLDCGDAVADWLSDCLEASGLRLIQQNAVRRSNDGTAKDMTLANQAQFLLINRTSVRWLAAKVQDNGEPLDHTVDRFRANIIIETATPFEENAYAELSVRGDAGTTQFNVDGFCTRCQMICIDQHSGQKTNEPLRTIAREFQGKIRFGVYLSLKECDMGDETILSCHDAVQVLAKT